MKHFVLFSFLMSHLIATAQIVSLENQTQYSLLVTSAHSSCPCITFALSEETVFPSTSTALHYEMNLAGMEGQVERFIFIELKHNGTNKTSFASSRPSSLNDAQGPSVIRKTITYSVNVKENGPVTIPITESTRSIILTVVGESNPSACLKPVGANFGTVASSKLRFEPRHTVLRGTNTNAQVVSISSAPAPFVVTADADKKGFSVALAKDARPGRYIDQLTVKTTDPAVPEMPFYLYAHILGDIDVLPNAIEVSRSQPTASAVMLLRPIAKKAFHVLSARTVPDLGTLRTQSLPDGSWRVLLSDIPTADVLPRSFLLVETDLPDSKEIKLPIVIANPSEAKP